MLCLVGDRIIPYWRLESIDRKDKKNGAKWTILAVSTNTMDALPELPSE